MARKKTHIKDCERLLGKGYPHIHDWLDDYAYKYPVRIHLEYHRRFRHTKKALDKQFKKLDFDEILACKIHIIRDVEQHALQKPMGDVELNEVEGLYEKALKYCHWEIEKGILK